MNSVETATREWLLLLVALALIAAIVVGWIGANG